MTTFRNAASAALFPFVLTAGAASAAPIQWAVGDGGNGHYYEFFLNGSGLTNDQVEAQAESSTYLGLSGYLATITSQAEQDFLNTIWPGPGSVAGQFGGYSFYLIGASDRDNEGTFIWIGGPEEGQVLSYTNWSSGEPNNSGDEDFVTAWWLDSAAGVWNDGGSRSSVAAAYLVEYSGPVSAVPLPAGLPLLLAGLGAFVGLRRRRGQQ
jgi:hypothetical protein